MESSKSSSESPDQAEFRDDKDCALVHAKIILSGWSHSVCQNHPFNHGAQVKWYPYLRDIHIQSRTSTAPVPWCHGFEPYPLLIVLSFPQNSSKTVRHSYKFETVPEPCMRAAKQLAVLSIVFWYLATATATCIIR